MQIGGGRFSLSVNAALPEEGLKPLYLGILLNNGGTTMNITWKDALDWWNTNDDLIVRIDRIMDRACRNFWGASDMPALADKFLRPHFNALCNGAGIISDDDFDVPDWSAAKAILDSMADKAINDIKDLV